MIYLTLHHWSVFFNEKDGSRQRPTKTLAVLSNFIPLLFIGAQYFMFRV